jgi:hypothetical protein
MDTSTSESPAGTDAVFVFGSNLARGAPRQGRGDPDLATRRHRIARGVVCGIRSGSRPEGGCADGRAAAPGARRNASAMGERGVPKAVFYVLDMV